MRPYGQRYSYPASMKRRHIPEDFKVAIKHKGPMSTVNRTGRKTACYLTSSAQGDWHLVSPAKLLPAILWLFSIVTDDICWPMAPFRLLLPWLLLGESGPEHFLRSICPSSAESGLESPSNVGLESK